MATRRYLPHEKPNVWKTAYGLLFRFSWERGDFHIYEQFDFRETFDNLIKDIITHYATQLIGDFIHFQS